MPLALAMLYGNRAINALRGTDCHNEKILVNHGRVTISSPSTVTVPFPVHSKIEPRAGNRPRFRFLLDHGLPESPPSWVQQSPGESHDTHLPIRVIPGIFRCDNHYDFNF